MNRACGERCGGRPLAFRVVAAKGFGSIGQPTKKPSKQSSQKVLDEALKEAKKMGRKRPSNWSPARPVDAKEAAKGSVEFVKVKDWGSGQPDDLGQLQVADDSTPRNQSSPSSSSSQGSTRPQPQRRLDGSLFGQLAAATQSPMVMQRMRRTPEIPPYEKWRFSNPRYQQYLTDTLAIHSALEDATAAIVATAEGTGGGTAAQLASALAPLGPSLRIRRGEQLKADLRAMTAAGGAQGGSSSNVHNNSSGPKPSPAATAYAQCLRQLSRDWRAAEGEEDRCQTAGRLLAHAFVAYTSFAALATRVGAAAAEKLNLFKIGAVSAYQEYPQEVADPLSELRAVVDQVERGLAGEGRLKKVYDWAVQEMPRALEECSLLVQSVAAE